MSFICPAGHTSTTLDYCDTCGAAINPKPTQATPVVPPPPTAGPCPNCGARHEADDPFCEACGLDFATGALPAPPPPPGPATAATPPGADPAGTPTGWVAVVEVDPDFYATNQVEDPISTAPMPTGVAPREVPLDAEEIHIGRHSDSKGIHPDIDLGRSPEDPGVSRRHAVLRLRPDGTWELVDTGSTNGTRVNDGATPIAANEPVALAEGDRVLVGMWTRITVKKTP